MARVTALVAILGIAFGVAVLIVALALANGFRDEMRDKILRGTAHITLMRKDGEAMTDWRNVAARAGKVDGVREAVGTTYDGALLRGPSGPAYAVLRGIDINSENSKRELSHTLVEGRLDPMLKDRADVQDPPNKNSESKLEPDIESFEKSPTDSGIPNAVIGSELAARAGLSVGDVAQLISGDGQLTPLGLAPRYRRLRISGVFRSGLYEYDATWIYLSLPISSSIAGKPSDSASVISIQVNDIYDVGKVGYNIRERLGNDFITVDWQEANRPLFAALTLERRMGLIVIGLIIFIATLNISATLVLVVVERRRDIAILIAMGARARNIMLIFVIEGACVGLIGAIAGVLIGIIACFVGDRYKLVSLPADVYSLNNIPFHTNLRDIALAASVAFLLSLIATIYPSRTAARLRSAEALREN
jgi:lipoprotein-releasing system permease protein